jgi:hypothetical protein
MQGSGTAEEGVVEEEEGAHEGMEGNESDDVKGETREHDMVLSSLMQRLHFVRYSMQTASAHLTGLKASATFDIGRRGMTNATCNKSHGSGAPISNP